MVGTMVFIIFIIVSFIMISLKLEQNFGKSCSSLILNCLSFLVSFIFTRFLVHSKVVDFVGNRLMEMIVLIIGDLSSFGELKMFIGSIIVGIISFYIFYFVISIVFFILKHIFIYYKFDELEEKNEKSDNIILKKIGIIATNLISISLTFVILVTPIGFLFDTVSTIFLKKEKKVPFVSKVLLNKLTEMPDNINDISTTDEIFYTLYTIEAISNLKEENGSNYIPEIKNAISSKTHFLPTIIADVASTGASNWGNDQDFLGYQPIFPEGREGKLYKSILEIVEKWNKQKVTQDINTTLDIYEQILDYGIDKIKEKDGILIALSEKEFTEKLFVNLYKNSDFCELIPIFMEYGLGSVFDYIGMDFDEENMSHIDISKFSEEDIRREARLVAEMINIVSDINSANQKIKNGEITMEDLQKIKEEISKLEGSKILGDIANELKFQLEKNLQYFEF